MLFADNLSLLSNVHDQLQTMLNRLRAYAHRKYLTVNTQKSEVMCFISKSDNHLPPLYTTACNYPTPTHLHGMWQNIYLTTAADAALRPFITGTFRVKKFVQENILTNRLHASHLARQNLCSSCLHVREPDLVNSFFITGQRDGKPSSKVAADSGKNNPWGQKYYSFLVRYARVWPWAPTVQLVSRHDASLQFSDPMQQQYCQKSFTCWHATELQTWCLLVFPYILSHDWSGTRVHVQKKGCGTANPLT